MWRKLLLAGLCLALPAFAAAGESVSARSLAAACNTCHGVHNYHPIKPAKEPGAAKTTTKKAAVPRKPKADPALAAANEWAALQSTRDPAQAIPYDMNSKYRLNNLLMHQQFGLGIVQLVVQNKIEVLFEAGKKRMRCG